MTGEHMHHILDAATGEERQRAARALLTQPLLSAAAEPEAFELIRRHRDWLRAELLDLAGYELAVHAGGWARLRKRPIDPDDVRPLRFPPLSAHTRRSTAVDRRPAFTQRQYVLLALSAAALCQGVRYISLQRLLGDVRNLALDHGLTVDLYGADRRAFVGVLLWLDELGGIQRRPGGDLDRFRDGAQDADAFWQVNGPLISDLLGARRPFTADLQPLELFDDRREYATADDRRTLRGRWRVARRLLETSVVYVAELDDDERAWWRTKRAWTEERCAELTGLVIERRREGTMLVEETAESRQALTDLRFPSPRLFESQMAVCLCEFLAAHLRAGPGDVLRADVIAEAERLAGLYGRHWRLHGAGRAALIDLLDDALALLAAHHLVRDDGTAVTPYPAIARFAHADVRARAEEAA